MNRCHKYCVVHFTHTHTHTYTQMKIILELHNTQCVLCQVCSDSVSIYNLKGLQTFATHFTYKLIQYTLDAAQVCLHFLYAGLIQQNELIMKRSQSSQKLYSTNAMCFFSSRKIICIWSAATTRTMRNLFNGMHDQQIKPEIPHVCKASRLIMPK